MRSAYAGQFGADGGLLAISDLANVPQVWSVSNGAWPELVVAPPDRAQVLHTGPRPGQMAVGADVGGNEQTQILLVERPAGQWRPLTEDPGTINHFGTWSQDGRRFSFASNRRAGRWFDVYVHDLVQDRTQLVLEHDSTNYAGAFSPDGRWLIATRQHSLVYQELWLLDLEGQAPPRRLTPDEPAVYLGAAWAPGGRSLLCVSDFGRDLAGVARVDVGDGSLDFVVDADVEVDEAALRADGRLLAYLRNEDGAHRVIVRDLHTGEEREVPSLPHGATYTYYQEGLAWDTAGRRLAISWTSSRAQPNVWVYDADAHAATQATHAPTSGVRAEDLVEPEHVTYPTFDGRQIPALYYAPRAVGPTPPPCVVVVHGGPEGQYRPTFQPVVQYLVSAGMAVLAPNVRGSTGYGKAYGHLDDVRRRMDSVADLAHAAYWLRDSGRADGKRIAVYGGSYGGFMVLAALTTYPDLWAAGVDLVGIANFVTFLQNTGAWRRHLREAEYGSIEKDRAFLESISPINHVEKITAPLLVIHGANDQRVPIGEAEQIVARLRELGRTVEFLCLEDEGHQVAKLKNKLLAYPLAAEFLRRHLRV